LVKNGRFRHYGFPREREEIMAIVLTEAGEFTMTAANGLWLTAADAERATGWTLKPEGMCHGEICVPLPAGVAREGRVDLAAFWHHFGNPVLRDEAGETWLLGVGAEDRNRALAGLMAPDFTLPDLDGTPHTLSALRGKKVFLTTWASWCGCRFDLAVWQELFQSVKDRNFMIVAVAEESRGAEHARQWIELAKPEYWNLIDIDHHVAALYGMVNVPQSVWIDETGRIVRPTETAGSTDHFRRMDLTTRTMAPEDRAASVAARKTYLDALKDWVSTGKYALDAQAAKRKLPRITPEIALANAHFRFGVWLRRHGKTTEGDKHLADASRLHPDSWNIWRQAADLDEVGKASGADFWKRVQALGERPYYPPPELAGFPASGGA
jgi:peroxiredoxin